jgi:hypothetical protein
LERWEETTNSCSCRYTSDPSSNHKTPTFIELKTKDKKLKKGSSIESKRNTKLVGRSTNDININPKAFKVVDVVNHDKNKVLRL